MEESKNSLAFRGNPEAQLDLLTGLPNKVAAENAILGLRGRPNFYLACYYVRGLEFLTVRYGDKIANEVLFLSAQSIANTSHGATDQLFRWRGPAFVAIIQREDNLIDVERNVQRMIGPKLQFYLRGGTMLVSVTLGVGVFSAAESNCAEVIRDVENFFLLPATRGC